MILATRHFNRWWAGKPLARASHKNGHRFRTGEERFPFATVLQRKIATSHDDRPLAFYEVRVESGAIVAWLETETALWHKPVRAGWTTVPVTPVEPPKK